MPKPDSLINRPVVRRLVRLTLASCISIGAMAFLLRHVEMAELWAKIRGVDPLGLGSYLLSLCVVQVARAWRWRTLLLPLAPVSVRSGWRMSNVGNLMIMLLPLRLGEFSRPLLLRQEYGQPLSAGMGAAVVERVLDGLLVTLLFFATTAAIAPPYEVPKPLFAAAVLALLLFGGALVAIVAMLLVHDPFVAALRRVGATLGARGSALLAKATAMLEAFTAGMRALPSWSAWASVLTSTLGYWAANALGMSCLLAAFGFALPLGAGATLVCVLVIGVMIPAGPGLLGTYQAALVAGLAVYHVPREAALAFSLVAYAGNLAILLCFGLPHLIAARLRPSAPAAEARAAAGMGRSM